MNFIDIGHGAELVGQIGDRFDRGNVAIHRIDGFEHDQLGALFACRGEQVAQMVEVIVAENLLFHTRLPHTLNH